MILPIVLYGSPILRKKASPIDKNYEGFKQLVEDMFETMETSDGVGLAAPQIGKSIQLFVIDATAYEDDDPSVKGFRKTFINPEIYERGGELKLFNEGCLSLPGIREDVSRPEKIKMRYFDENFVEHDEEFDGVKARIIQHEYDHLEGILFPDKLQPLKRRLLNGKLNNIVKGKVDVNYRVRIAK
ncbi:MAG: peptide deformylase [Bacteroidales bacterium]|nr:peptide deformylase [Bacteroidales bacterium]